MVKHIVLFKLKPSISLKEKKEMINNFKHAIEALSESMDFIRSVFVGANINEDEKWDICLESEFDTLDDVRRYSSHPLHLAAAAILKDVKEERACVDFEF